MPRRSTSKKTNPPPNEPEAATEPAAPLEASPKSYLPTTQTGLQDYAYWWRYAREHAKTVKPNAKTFRRGRIWT